jgi:CheY-like chemotaxis protein
MLVDDNSDDNFYHERIIKKSDPANVVIAKQTGMDALEYLKARNDTRDTLHPELILLDINMPGMNGWEFLEAYRLLEKNKQGKLIVVILTTSENPDDYRRALDQDIATEFRNKPLTKDMLAELIDKFL